ncbi:MAG: DMT family transporter [Alphaproteobacteria bacterium]|nr:DMT family transporter [Alphaproteobacteria bacterium]
MTPGARWQAVPAALRGALWMFVAAMAFAAMSALIRRASEELHPFQIGFFRCLFGTLLMAPYVLRSGLSRVRTQRFGLHALRAMGTIASILTYFLALSLMPIATAAALSFTAPLFATMGAGLVLGEKVGPRRWAAVIVGLTGTWIVIRPGVEAVSLPALLVLVSSCFVALEILVTKKLSATEPPQTVVLYMGLLSTPALLVPALLEWTEPSWAAIGWAVGVATAGTIGHLAVVRSFRLADATAVMPIEFSKLIFVAIFGFAFFDQVPDVWTWIGGAVIFGAGLYTAHRESVRRGQARGRADPPPPSPGPEARTDQPRSRTGATPSI